MFRFDLSRLEKPKVNRQVKLSYIMLHNVILCILQSSVVVVRWLTYTYLLIILHLFHPQSQHQSSHKKSTYDSDI